MAKQIDISNPFGNTPDLNNPQEVDETLFGKVPIGKQGKLDRIRNLEITSILPDPMQPRRVVPSVVRQQSDGTPQNLITTWLDMITAERRARFEQALEKGRFTEHDRPDDAFPLHMYLSSGETERGWNDPTVDNNSIPQSVRDVIMEFGALEASFMKVIDLASSIHRDGLSNAITVAKLDTDQYIIETGERRWLAYHLLDMVFEDEDYSKIPARLVEEVSIWRQAAENNARDNLNAISRARQLAILLMDLYGYDQFQPMNAFDHELDFYAQVAEGDQFPVPRGKGEQVVNAMGLKNVVQIRQYRALLRQPRELWEFFDDTDMTEHQIRDWDQTTTVTPVTPHKQKLDRFSKIMDRLENELSEKKWNKLSKEQRKARYATLESLLHRLDAWGIE